MKQVVIEKLDQATVILNELNIDMWITFVRETSAMKDPVLSLILGREHLTWQSALILGSDGTRTAVVGRLESQAIQDLGAYHEVIPYDESIRPHLLKIINDCDPKQIAINTSTSNVLADGLSYGMYQVLMDILIDSPYQSRLVSAEDIISALRGRKTAQEIVRIKSAIQETLEIYEEIYHFIRPGMTEFEIANRMKFLAEERHLDLAWSASSCPAVNSGPDSPVGHNAPSQIVVQPGHLLHFDFGVRKDGYCSDIQRLVYMLRPGENDAPQNVKRAFHTLQESIKAAAKLMKPGAAGHKVDAAARQVVTSAGYPEYKYATGHQLGQLAHDGGGVLAPLWERYGNTPHLLLETGQVYTIEPGVMVPGFGYAGLEEDVLVTEDEIKYLGPPQEALILISPSQRGRINSG